MLAYRTLATSRAALEAARMALEAEHERFRHGFGSVNDVLRAEDSFSGAEYADTETLTSYVSAEHNLRKATGTLLRCLQ